MALKKSTWVALIIAAICSAVLFNGYLLLKEIKHPPLPVLGEVLPFSLTDSNGNSFQSKTLNGKIWIANFFFTTCADICPMMTKHMASLYRSFKLVKDIELVSFSVNPEIDSPQKLSAYAQKYNADSKKWHFLTGSREAITNIAVKSFKVGDVKEPIFHSAFLCLVDRNGIIRGYYEGTDKERVNKLFVDASNLLKEK